MNNDERMAKAIQAQKRKNAELVKQGKPPQVYNLLETGIKGEPTSVCTKCGRTFDQELPDGLTTFTNWKTCPECRATQAKTKEDKVRANNDGSLISIKPPPYTPYPWQEEASQAFETHRFVVLSCGNRCLFEGAFINGADKPVEQLTKKDKVISKNGELQKVLDVWREDYKGEIYTVSANGIMPFECTPEHPLMVAWVKKNRYKSGGEIVQEKLVCANELEAEQNKLADNERLYLKMPRIKGSVKTKEWQFPQRTLDGKKFNNSLDKLPLNEDTAWMLGLYCAEGSFIGKGGCHWTLNYKEPELADKLVKIIANIGVKYRVNEHPESGTRRVTVSKTQFCRKLVEQIGLGSLNKHIPYDILYNEDESLLVAFLKGYYAGDGCYKKNVSVLEATSVSRTLVQQLQVAWCRLGYYAKLYFQNRKNRFNKDGSPAHTEYSIKINNNNAAELLGYETVPRKQQSTAIFTDEAIYVKLKDVIHNYGEKSLIGVSTFDESFVCNGVIHHNCGKDRASTMIGIKYFLECLNENRQIEKPEVVPSVLWWIVAPTERMAKQNWRELKQFFPKELVVAVADSTLTMATVGGGIIEVRSGYDGQQLVGVGLDLVTITEAARMNDLMMSWANIQARLDSPDRGRDKDRMGSKAGYGKAIINSSPLGKNDFYDLFCFGQKDHPNYNSEWWSAQYPWTANPAMAEAAQRKVQTKFGEITYEEQLRRQMPDHMFRSNYLGEFVSDLGNVFRSFEEKCVFDPYSPEHHLTQTEIDEVIKTWQSPKIGESYVGGYDPATGSSGDSPAFVIREVNSNRIVRIYDLYGKTYEQQYNFIAEMCKQFNYAPIYWLRTGHTAIEGQFERRGIAEFPLDEQAGKKAKLVQTLELAVENGDVQIINDRKPVTQTLIYEMADYSEKNGRYANDKTPHDDFVSALYAAFSDYTVEKVPVTFCGLMGGAN